MSRNKKLGFLGLTAAIFAYSVVYSAFGGSAIAASQRANAVQVIYQEQKDPYFCGQASAQMAIQMIQGRFVSQFRLEREMSFIPGAGTRNIHMVKPFQSRGIEVVRIGLLSNLAHLRDSVDQGHYSIINIRFDETKNSGHYVLVTGYNATGFFVHDPWPEDWGEPVGRETGENAYVDAGLLGELWAFRLYWVLTVAGPGEAAGIQEGLDWS
jgi:Peptidase_C39 like family